MSGQGINAKVLDIGADWQTICAAGLAELDTRDAIETDNGAQIEIINYGYRYGPAELIAAIAQGENVPADQYTMRTMARMETGDERYGWVNRTFFVGTGARLADAVHVALYAVN